MYDRQIIRSFAIRLLVFVAFMAISVQARAQIKPGGGSGNDQLFIKGVTSVDVSLKKKPCCKQNLYRVGDDGRINLGTLEEGEYTIQFVPVPATDPGTAASARMAAPQVPPRLTFVLEGPQSGPLVVIWDQQTGLFFNINTLSFERAPEFEITIGKNKVVTGHVAGLTIDEPGIK